VILRGYAPFALPLASMSILLPQQPLGKTLRDALTMLSMPFINQMVAGFGKDTTSCAKFAGVIESALVLTEGEYNFCTSRDLPR
jgi:hypothetical protein